LDFLDFSEDVVEKEELRFTETRGFCDFGFEGESNYRTQQGGVSSEVKGNFGKGETQTPKEADFSS
jgi:hypothetical protein